MLLEKQCELVVHPLRGFLWGNTSVRSKNVFVLSAKFDETTRPLLLPRATFDAMIPPMRL